MCQRDINTGRGSGTGYGRQGKGLGRYGAEQKQGLSRKNNVSAHHVEKKSLIR